MTTTPDADAWCALLQLSSPAFPVGGFSYSQGLESAIEQGWVRNELELLGWLDEALAGPQTEWEAVHVLRCLRAWAQGDGARLSEFDAHYLSGRESAELWQETRQMAWSLRQLLPVYAQDRLSAGGASRSGARHETQATGRLQAHIELIDSIWPEHPLPDSALQTGPSYPCVWTALAQAWLGDESLALQSWLWSWLENQVMVALKAIPLGQTQGQSVLLAMRRRLGLHIQRARHLVDDPLAQAEALGNFYPGMGLLCARHETQYCRLFRS